MRRLPYAVSVLSPLCFTAPLSRPFHHACTSPPFTPVPHHSSPLTSITMTMPAFRAHSGWKAVQQ